MSKKYPSSLPHSNVPGSRTTTRDRTGITCWARLILGAEVDPSINRLAYLWRSYWAILLWRYAVTFWLRTLRTVDYMQYLGSFLWSHDTTVCFTSVSLSLSNCLTICMVPSSTPRNMREVVGPSSFSGATGGWRLSKVASTLSRRILLSFLLWPQARNHPDSEWHPARLPAPRSTGLHQPLV